MGGRRGGLLHILGMFFLAYLEDYIMKQPWQRNTIQAQRKSTKQDMVIVAIAQACAFIAGVCFGVIVW